VVNRHVDRIHAVFKPVKFRVVASSRDNLCFQVQVGPDTSAQFQSSAVSRGVGRRLHAPFLEINPAAVEHQAREGYEDSEQDRHHDGGNPSPVVAESTESSVQIAMRVLH
jgi:hypothetical protein